MKSAFFALLIVALLAFSLFPYSHATSISVQYSTNDNSNLANAKVLYANGTTDGALGNSPSWVSGVFGKALDFNGANQYSDTPSSSILNPTSAITLMAWIYPHTVAPDYQSFIEKDYEHQWELMLVSNYLIVNINIAGVYQASYLTTHYLYTFSANKWYFIVFTFDGTNGVLNVNNTIITSRNDITGAIGTSSSDLIFGVRGVPDYLPYDGLEDEVREYNRALTPIEQTSIWENNTLITSGLLSYWNFDEGSGAKVYGYNSIVTFNIHSTPQTLTISQTASAPNSSLLWYSLPFSNSTDLYNSTTYSWRVNNASTQTIPLTHYVYLTIAPSPLTWGGVNRTSGFIKAYTQYTIQAFPYLGYFFEGWTSSTHPGIYSTSNPLTFQTTMYRTLYANFSASTTTSTTPSVDTSLTVLPSYIWDVGAIIASFFFLMLAFKWPVFGFIAFSISIIVFLNDIANGWAYNVLYRNGTAIMSNTVYVAIPTWYLSVIGVIILIQVFSTIMLIGKRR